ncbi:GntR family transcriptional regulator [Vibrio hannami]|uniref:GntR family transcriptional regulator n=1 Tax=Vibrio hannami TaxID=2717094 RepID=UPI00240E9F54|nr:GntR family transcriptional regulator [Vibrio hannami]MDG3085344.1 GntR family transcriptional regulator [Vibrio hannami]
MKYVSIYQDIKSMILNNRFGESGKLPDGISLASQYLCSEATIKKALDLLVKEGLVIRKRGSGSFIKNKPCETKFCHGDTEFTHLFGTTTNVERCGQNLETKLVCYEVTSPTKVIASALNIETDDLVYKIQRIRIINDTPTTFEETYMPICKIPGLKKMHAETSIYRYLTQELKLNIHSSDIALQVILADEVFSQYLNVPIMEPLVQVTQEVFLDSGDVLEYATITHLSKGFTFKTNYIKNKALEDE